MCGAGAAAAARLLLPLSVLGFALAMGGDGLLRRRFLSCAPPAAAAEGGGAAASAARCVG